MAAIRIPNPATGEQAQPVRVNGSRYPIEIVQDTWRILAETPEDVMEALIPGYTGESDDRARLEARRELAVEAQIMVQTLLNAGEAFDTATEEEARILLHDRHSPPAPTEWECAVPLVLVSHFYEPTGGLPQPRTAGPGQIWWIDPSTERSLLETLHAVRWLDLENWPAMENPPEDRAAERGDYRNLGMNGAGGYRWRSVPRQARK